MLEQDVGLALVAGQLHGVRELRALTSLDLLGVAMLGHPV